MTPRNEQNFDQNMERVEEANEEDLGNQDQQLEGDELDNQ